MSLYVLGNPFSIFTSQGKIQLWESRDEGFPVLFLPGNSACGEAFSEQFSSPLAKKYRFITLDLPGQGESDRAQDPKNTYNYEGYAQIIQEVIEKLHLSQPPVIVGWSLGGHIGLSMLKRSQNLAGLLITGTPPSIIEENGRQKGFKLMPAIAHLFNQEIFNEEEASAFMSHGGFDVKKDVFIVKAAIKADGLARLANVEWKKNHIGYNQREVVENNPTPLCIIQGEEDQGIDNAYIQSIKYKNLFNHQVYIIPKAKHAVFKQCPEEFNAILELFLSHVENNGMK